MIRDMKTRISKLNIDFESYWEPIYLVLLAFFVGMRFLLSTMFTIYWPKYFYRTLTVIGVVLVLLHLMLAKDISKKEIAAMLVVTFVFMMSHYVSGYDFLVDLLILILGAYRVNFRNILKTYIAVWSVLLVVTIIGAMTGLAENLVYYQGERVRVALGICYPTDLAAYVVFFMFAYVCVRDENITCLELGIMCILSVAVFYVTDARNNFGVMISLLFLILLSAFFKKNVLKIMCKKETEYLMMLFPVVICALIWILTYCYRNDNPFFVWLNEKILSGRLSLGKQGIDDYGISAFGKYFSEVGYGGRTDWPGMYNFLDSSYISIGIKYGIIFLLTILVMFIKFVMRLHNKHKYIWEIVFCMLILQSFMEHHFIQYWYNPFLLSVFSALVYKNPKVENKMEIVDLNFG